MIRGIRRVSVERGHDPRKFSMFCFGGGGPLHGVEMASELNIPRVIIPISPGVNSAVGLLMADFRYDYSKTYLRKVSALDLEELNGHFRNLEEQAQKEMLAEKIPRDKIVFNRSVDMRYFGQGYEVEVPVPNGSLTERDVEGLRGSFNRIHAQLYGYDQPDEEMEIVYVRLASIGEVSKPEFYKEGLSDQDAGGAVKGTRQVYMDGRYVETVLYDRSRLRPNNRFEGPAIVEQFDSTTIIKPGQTVYVDEFFNMLIQVKGS